MGQPASRLGAFAQLGSALTAGAFTTMPAIAASGGMTLTEMPSMMILVVALVGICVMLRFDEIAILLWHWLWLPALPAAAVLGRQDYFVVLPCLFLSQYAQSYRTSGNSSLLAW
jgi:hypothetical protein